LVIATTLLLGATSDMGLTRDESFYFRYAETYQSWFSDLGSAIEDGDASTVINRESVDETWRQNFEHPPLMKVLFGWSWRSLALKRRNMGQFRHENSDKDVILARINNSSAADGFQQGDTVRLLGPHPVGTAANDDARVLGTGTIVERESQWSTVATTDQTLRELRELCTPPSQKDPNAPHPWMAGCQVATTSPTHVLSESQALRFPAWVFAGLLIGLIYILGTQLFGRSAGFVAAISLLFVPRFFFHAHLSAFDVGVVTMSLATIYAYWRSLSSTRWAIAAGIIWGFALLTKHNAFFIPIPLVLAWLAADMPRVVRNPVAPPLSKRRRWTARLSWMIAAVIGMALGGFKLGIMVGIVAWLLSLGWTQSRLRFPAMPTAFLLMPPIGLGLYFLLWPLLWYDTAQSFHEYFSFHWEHVHYLQQYFGMVLQAPPFPTELPVMMTVLTVPVPQLLLFLIGFSIVFVSQKNQHNKHDRWLLLLNMLFPIALISLPNTPIFGGVKHWFASMVFFALFVGVGFNWLHQKTVALLSSRTAFVLTSGAVIATLLLSSSIVDSIRHRRHGTAYYNLLAGGVDGAADWRMHRQFWGYAGRYGLDYVNQFAPRNGRVAFHNTTYDAVSFYKRDGLLRDDVHWQRDPSGNCRTRSELLLFHHQESFAQEEMDGWKQLKTWTPVEVHTSEGVPMLSIYRCSPGTAVDKM